MKLYMDDDLLNRPTPEGWVRAQSVNEAIELLKTGEVEEASLDHDLGYFELTGGGNGMKLVDWMEANKIWPKRITIHSISPSGLTMYKVCSKYTVATHKPYKA